MIEFTLVHTYNIEPDGTVNVCLKPSDNLISDYISTWRLFSSISEADAALVDFKSEMTPLLYADFTKMENVPADIRSKFQL
jgi:hypothetical protein